MVVYFDTLADYEAKNAEIAAASNWPAGTTRYADESPAPKVNGKYEMPVLQGYEQFFAGMEVVSPIAEVVVPPAPTYTAEEIVSRHFSAYQIAALQRLEMALLAANKPLGPQMTAAKTWLEGVMLGWAVDPTAKPAAAFGEPSVTFEQASAEAVAGLQS